MRRHQAFALAPVKEIRFGLYGEASGFRYGPRERKRRCRVYEEAPDSRPGPHIL